MGKNEGESLWLIELTKTRSTDSEKAMDFLIYREVGRGTREEGIIRLFRDRGVPKQQSDPLGRCYIVTRQRYRRFRSLYRDTLVPIRGGHYWDVSGQGCPETTERPVGSMLHCYQATISAIPSALISSRAISRKVDGSLRQSVNNPEPSHPQTETRFPGGSLPVS